MKDYDSWLEKPYQDQWAHEAPAQWDEYADREAYVETEDAIGTVVDYEPWEDEDEDGKYGGIELIVGFPATSGRETYTIHMTPEEFDSCPAERPKEE